MAGAATSLVLAAAPALASGQRAGPASITPEAASGTIHGKPATAEFPAIPLSWQGLVDTHSTFVLRGHPPKKGQEYTFTTAAGKLVVLVTAPPRQSQRFNLKACRFSGVTTLAFAAVPGRSTGKFAGAAGPAAVKVSFAGYAPKYKSGPKKGQCDTSANAPILIKGAFVSFLFSAVLTTE